MVLEWELCKIFVVCEIKCSDRFMVFRQKDNASIPHIEEMSVENMQTLCFVCSILQQIFKEAKKKQCS